MQNESKKALLLGALAVIMAATVFGGIWLTRNLGKTEKAVSAETASKKLEKVVAKIDPQTAPKHSSPVDFDGQMDLRQELPDIETCQVTAKAPKSPYAEIFSSPEKAEDGANGWLVEAAEKYNRQDPDVYIQVRDVNSGQALDYIASSKAVPAAWTPSASFWTDMAEALGTPCETVAESLVGNTAGIVLKNSVHKELAEKYGSVDWKAVTEAVAAKEISFGTTNAFSSTAGLNGMEATLLRYDSKDPFSDTAVEGFRTFQSNVPLIAMTTVQMVKAADKGTLDGFIMEYQAYMNNAAMKSGYTFTPYGRRHDNPLVLLPGATEEQKNAVKDFAAFCASSEMKALADSYGFNANPSYKPEAQPLTGEQLLAAQQVYKDNKDGNKKIAAVFVTDVSGSMEHDGKMDALKDSLINAMSYINQDAAIGIVSFSDDVTIELPIAEFDMDQQALFKGAVENLSPLGGTAMFDGTAVALSLLEQYKNEHADEDIRPVIFVLGDGNSASGHSLNDIRDILESMRIPAYTIGYGTDADKDALQALSDIGEAESIHADTDDVAYKLKGLFNTNM